MNTAFDAIAVGGSLAGCAFAMTLARAGRRVALIERTHGAQPKVCGDFLSAEAVVLLGRLGLDPSSLGGHAIGTFRMAVGGAVADAPLGMSGLGVSRLLLDEALLAACADAGVDVLRGQTVEAVDVADDRVRVRAGGTVLQGGCAALATGKHNLRGYPRDGGGPTAYKMTFVPGEDARQGLEGVVQLALYDGGYAGACLIEGGGMTVCWLANDALMRDSAGRWQDQLAIVSEHSGALADVLRDAEPAFDKPAAVTALPFGYMRRAEIAAQIYPLGDQLAVIPPLAGDGTSIALKSGIDAAQAVLRGQPAAVFQTGFLRNLKTQFGWASAVQAVFGNRYGRRAAVGLVGGVPGIATWLTRRTRLAGV
ncbi:MAG: hypothetical protein KDE55_10550 [Novosphingobium sp.]|nr:hypothetical protein [Novosphingobium sp.]